MYLHLIVSSLFPIFVGSHASLQRPPSAATPKKSENNEEDDEIEVETTIEGLTPSDAIMFPLGAGITLGGLYLVIKWMNNPDLLNKILNWYFCGMGIFSVGRFAANALDVATTFVFPSVWSSGKETYHVEPLLSQQVTGPVKPAGTQTHRKFVDKMNPFPGFLSSIRLPTPVNKQLWSIRALLKKNWVLRFYVHGITNSKTKINMNDTLGLVFGIASIAIYNFSSKHWLLTNLMGTSFAYGAFQLISLTTFWTGTLVLGGLFFYDIAMVFYTPMMITVATTLEVPIKLVFPGPKRGSMLGLGDVVLPGLMIALALRFDLYMHYLRKQRKAINAGTKEEKLIRAPYIEATGEWGERFWTSSLTKKATSDEIVANGGRFPKPYFWTSMIAYVLAMIVCLVVMNIFNHGQPALLYLVPGVLISAWGTALVRGEVKEMWEYTEDGIWGFEQVEEEKKSLEDGKQAKDGDGSSVDSEASTVVNEKNQKLRDEEKAKEKKDKEKEEHAHPVFLLSLSEPKVKSTKKSVILNQD